MGGGAGAAAARGAPAGGGAGGTANEKGAARSFHKIFCQTQGRAQILAQEFNRRLDLIGPAAAAVPRVQFLSCSVYTVKEHSFGTIEMLVEEMIDQKRFRKCAFIVEPHSASRDSLIPCERI